MDLLGIARAADVVRGAHAVVALTGAGISVPSGIPDFRSANGLWQHDDPIEIASLSGFRANPARFYEWFRSLFDQVAVARPNPAHEALAELEHCGKLKAVITQNIDGLHQRSGAQEVYELHGHMRSATCLGCGRQVPAVPLIARLRQGEVPRCRCGEVFKPDVVFFDELLPRSLFWLAQHAVETCDALIVAGTALEVAPVCEMPMAALRKGARLVIINQSDTYIDSYADVVLHADVAEALPALLRYLQSNN